MTKSVNRWRERLPLRGEGSHWDVGKLSRAAWEAILARQAEEKAVEEAKLNREHESAAAEAHAEWDARSLFFDLDDSVAASRFNGKSLKVIVKVRNHQSGILFVSSASQAADYHLKAGQTYEGSWHLEGMVYSVSSRLLCHLSIPI